MTTGSASVSWEEASRGFFRHLKGVRAPKTLRFYEVQLTGLGRTTLSGEIGLTSESGFGEFVKWITTLV
jgi:hypothetical protein